MQRGSSEVFNARPQAATILTVSARALNVRRGGVVCVRWKHCKLYCYGNILCPSRLSFPLLFLNMPLTCDLSLIKYMKHFFFSPSLIKMMVRCCTYGGIYRVCHLHAFTPHSEMGPFRKCGGCKVFGSCLALSAHVWIPASHHRLPSHAEFSFRVLRICSVRNLLYRVHSVLPPEGLGCHFQAKWWHGWSSLKDCPVEPRGFPLPDLMPQIIRRRPGARATSARQTVIAWDLWG